MVEDNGGSPWVCLRMPGNGAGESEALESTTAFPRLTDVEQIQLLAMNVYPTLLFALSGNGGYWYQLEPSARDSMRLRIHLLLPPELASGLDAEALAGEIELVRAIHTEDIAVNEGPWRGLHAPLSSQGRLSPFEKGIWQLNQLWLDRLSPLLG